MVQDACNRVIGLPPRLKGERALENGHVHSPRNDDGIMIFPRLPVVPYATTW